MNLSPEFANPWGEILDLESLHGKVSGAIQSAAKQLRDLARQKDFHSARPLPMVVQGSAGAGKTHLFTRLRRTFGTNATLVHIRPLVGMDMTPRYVLMQIMEQLAYVSGGQRQLDTLSGALLSAALDGDPSRTEDALSLLRDIPDPGRRLFTNHLVEVCVREHPDLDEAYLAWLFRLPFLSFLSCRAALAWLGGRDLDEIQSSRIGVHASLPNHRVVTALRTLARIAAPHAPLVLVFDQLENLVGASQRHITAYGNLLAELVDVARDLVIVQMVLSTEWEHLRTHFSTSQRDRIEGQLLQLAPPSRQEAESLLKLWTSALPFPLPYPWPFTPQEAEQLCGAGTATPRMLLKELRRALESSEAPQVDLPDILSEVWSERLAWARSEIDRAGEAGHGPDPSFIMDGLHLLIRLMPGFRALDTAGSGGGEEWVDLETPTGLRRVVLMLQPNPQSISAAIRRMEPHTGPVLALREQWRDFKPTWKSTVQAWQAWIAKPHVQWHWLSREDVTRLLALESLHKSACSMDISDPEGEPIPKDKVMDWIRRELRFEDWTLAAALQGALEKYSMPAEDAPSPVIAPAPTRSQALEHLRRLRVASMGRLQRECSRDGQAISRSQLTAELRQARSQVRWIGDGIACYAE